MRTLVIGNGAREHALAYSLSRDPGVTEVHVCPGNPGMTGIAEVHPDAEPEALAERLRPDLVVIGPEIPLVDGLADRLRAQGLAVFGPSAEAAQIEGSKAFAKSVMLRAGAATARSQSLAPGVSEEEISAALGKFGPTFVVKDDGLAAGKGVVVTQERDEALAHIRAVHEAGNPVLLEHFLEGPEVSLFCLVDGETVVPLLPAQDHKRALDGDEGPNTGGMGAYTPLDWLPENAVQTIVDDVVRPVARQMVEDGVPFNGLLYAGLAWGPTGPSVVEFNCRFGDPETQAVLELLETPLGEVLSAVATGRLDEIPPLRWKDGYALTVVLAAEGYPASPVKGDAIIGAGPGSEERGVRAAGVAAASPGAAEVQDAGLVSDGGRVLNVVATGASLQEAREKAYQQLSAIQLRGGHYRTDIAAAAVNGEISV